MGASRTPGRDDPSARPRRLPVILLARAGCALSTYLTRPDLGAQILAGMEATT
jgi:hypothetical protein